MSNQPNPSAKVLRIGLFQNNRIIEERLLRTAKTVTIGSDISKRVDNTFVVPASDLPKSVMVFEASKAGQYVLHFTTQMTGRVKVGDEIKTLQDLIQSGKAQKTPTGFAVTLTQNSQGRLVVGEATLLFQFVTPPPPRAKPVLPASMRGGWIQGMDRLLATMVALSAILHIGAVLFLELQDWPEPLEQEFQIPDKFVQISVDTKEPEPLPEEPKPDENPEGEGEPSQSEEPAKDPGPAKKDPEPAEVKNDKPKSADDLAREEAERQRRLADKVRNKTILGQIGAVSADGSSGSLVDMLSSGAGKTSMEDAFANSKGITTGEVGAQKSTLRSSGSSDADGTGGKSIGIGELGPSSGAKKAAEGVGTGDKVDVKVKAKINLRTPEVVIGGTLDQDSISKIIKRNEGNFQRCYERELKKNPKAGGKIIVVFEIGTAGRVTKSSAEVDSVGGGTGECVAQAIERLRFPRPNGGPATVKKTFVFSSGG